MHHGGGRLSLNFRTSLAAVGVAMLYVLGTQVGLLLTPLNQPVSLLWPPNALLLAVLLLAPYRVWPWYVLAVLPVHFTTQLLNGIPLATSVGWFFTNVGESLIGAFLLRRLGPPRELFQRLTGFALFLSLSVLGATGVTSFLDAAVVIATGSGHEYWGVWERRFVSNALATLTLVPPIVMLGSSSIRPVLTRRPWWFVEGALIAVGTLFVVNLFFGGNADTQSAIPALVYTVLPLLFWAAVRFGPTGVSLLQLVATFAMLWAARRREPFSLHDIWLLQMLLTMLNVLSLSLAVVVRESRRLQSLHSAVLRSIPAAVAIVDRRGVIIETNEAWASTGAREDRPWFAGAGRYVNYLESIRSQAKHTPEAATLADGLQAVLTRAQSSFDMEYSSRLINDTRWFSVSIVPLSAERRGAVVTCTDITTRKHADAEAIHLRDELATAGRVMSVTMLSAALTHNLSQPLTAILANTQAAKRMVAREPSARPELDAILADVVTSSKRASSMLRQLPRGFKSVHHHAHPLSLNRVATDVLTLFRPDLLRRGIIIEHSLAPDLPLLRGDRMQLQQVVLNLVLNARDAMQLTPPSQRRIVVSTARSDRGVQLCIEDTGQGFPPELLETAFDPFVRTKTKGLGLGLALCRAIIQAHDGELTARNNDRLGATVCCTLPCAADVADEPTTVLSGARLAVDE